MGKYPSAILVATALVFCAFCPFFVTSNDTDEVVFRNGIESLLNIMKKYQDEFDRKVKFVQLQAAVDEIDKAMLGYDGKAKDKLPQIRSLNSDARLTYENCVGPVFEWCISVNSTFRIIIPMFNDSTLTQDGRNIIWNMTVASLNLGLEKTRKSLELLTNVQYKTAELRSLFKTILHDVHDDFGPKGFYGKEKVDLEVVQKTDTAAFVGKLFAKIGLVIFGPIGAAVGFGASFSLTYGILKLDHWQQKKTYQEQIKLIDEFFTVLTKKIEEATDIVKDIESALAEDKTNLHEFRGLMEGANTDKVILMMPYAFQSAEFISEIQNLKNQCTEYLEWHGYDTSFYQNIKSRKRRAASSFCEGQRSNAKDMLAQSESQANSTQSQKLGLIIDQMNCGGYIPPYSVERFQKVE